MLCTTPPYSKYHDALPVGPALTHDTCAAQHMHVTPYAPIMSSLNVKSLFLTSYH